MHEFHAHIEETKIKLWGVALLGCALNCQTRGAVWCEFLLGRGLWGKGAKGLRPAGQCYPGCHAVASSRLFCVLDAAILCLLSPWPSLSGSHVLPCPVIFRLFGSFGVPLSAHL